MPSVTLHMVLADRVLDRWKDAPSSAPFDPTDGDLANAFYQGALGPDLGYFPGGHRFLSDLCHLVRSGDLTRTLVRSADSPRERAYAWGWVTHVLGDTTVHPLVGRGVGELLYGNREIFVDGARHQAAHVQVETGLDAFYSNMFPELRHRRMAPVFHGSSIRFLVRAYQQIYRIPLDPTLFLYSHLATVRMSVHGLRSIGLMGTALLTRPVSKPMASAQRVLQRALSAMKGGMKDSLLLALLNPVPPAEWLMEAVGEVVEDFGELFEEHYRTQLAGLGNLNLDTGSPEDLQVTHVGTLRTLDLLGRWSPGRPPRLPGAGNGPLSGPYPRALPAPTQL